MMEGGKGGQLQTVVVGANRMVVSGCNVEDRILNMNARGKLILQEPVQSFPPSKRSTVCYVMEPFSVSQLIPSSSGRDF